MWIFENPKLKPEWLDSERGEPEEEEVEKRGNIPLRAL